jgi:hypothetical protein
MTITLVVSPVDLKTEGYRLPPDAPVRYKVRLGDDDGPILDEGLRCPFYTSARKLLEQGISPETPLAMRHAGSSTIAMTSTVGEAAKWTIEEGEDVGPRLKRYEPFDANVFKADMPLAAE